MIYTTLNKIREHEPCKGGWEKLLAHLGKTKADNEPLPLLTILDSNGLDDCLWSLRTVPEYSLWRKYAVWCARQVEHQMTDERSKQALDVAWRHAEGKATNEELDAAARAARAAAVAADAAAWAAWAAWAAVAAVAAVAADAARAAWEAVAANAAADAAWAAAMAAAMAAADAARDAAWDAAWEKQETKLRAVLASGEWMEDA